MYPDFQKLFSYLADSWPPEYVSTDHSKVYAHTYIQGSGRNLQDISTKFHYVISTSKISVQFENEQNCLMTKVKSEG